MLLHWLCRKTWNNRHVEVLFNFLKDIFHALPIQVPHHTIICQNGKLVIWKNNGKKIVKRFFPCIIRILLASLQPHFHSRGSSVMSVCNIKCRDLLHLILDLANRLIPIDHPHTVCDLVLFCKIIGSFVLFFPLLKKSIQRICITAGKINGACISITYIHMIDSVQLFI